MLGLLACGDEAWGTAGKSAGEASDEASGKRADKVIRLAVCVGLAGETGLGAGMPAIVDEALQLFGFPNNDFIVFLLQGTRRAFTLGWWQALAYQPSAPIHFIGMHAFSHYF